MTKGKLKQEFEEHGRFRAFLEGTGRLDAIDSYDREKGCIHVLEDFSALATKDHPETIDHLHKITKDYKLFREHALDCKRCQISLDALFVFKGHESPNYFFPEKIREIINLEFDYDVNKRLFVLKLPAPLHSNFGSSSARLVYVTNSPIDQGIKEFYDRVRDPLEFSPKEFTKPRAKKSWAGSYYWQADWNHKTLDYDTRISIRSRAK